MAAKDEQELSSFELASAKLSDAQKLTSEAHDLLKEDLEKVRREKAAFEEMSKTLNEVHFGKTIKLNVGGKIYETTLDTLRKDPDSMLSAIFSGRHELKPDEDRVVTRYIFPSLIPFFGQKFGSLIPKT